jgi:GGDEF domain-containing protein
MAHHDGLTDLPNREFYQERLREALVEAQTGNKRVAVLYVDRGMGIARSLQRGGQMA